MDCKVCHRTFISWDSRILEQLGDGVRARFSVVLTHNYACDQAVISLLRACTVGNSSTAFQHNLWEVHSEEWLRKQLLYLTDCQRHQKSLQTMKLPQPLYQETTHFPNFPTASWLLSTYVLDVWSRLPFLMAMVTSTFVGILKIDSTKKVCKKLQGSSAGSASWATNIGNERGEILQCVLIASE